MVGGVINEFLKRSVPRAVHGAETVQTQLTAGCSAEQRTVLFLCCFFFFFFFYLLEVIRRMLPL